MEPAGSVESVGEGAQPQSGARLVRRRAGVALLPLVLVLLLNIVVAAAVVIGSRGPNGQAFGGDFAMFLSAAGALNAGGNPYTGAGLYRAERSLLLQQQGIRIPRRRYVGVAAPPLLFWLLRPLTGLSFRPLAWCWIGAMYGLSILGLLAALRYLRWRRMLWTAVLFAAMPQVLFGAYYGQIDGLLFAAFAAGLLLSTRHPAAAGLLFSVSFLKPSVGLAIAVLALVFHMRDRVAAGAAFALGLLAFAGASLLTCGWELNRAWLDALLRHPGNVSTLGDVATLAGVYARWTPPGARVALELASILAALAVAALAWRRWEGRAVSVRRGGWLWIVWFLAAPFGHIHDELPLAVPVAALLGRDGARATTPLALVALYALALSSLLVFWSPGGVQLLWVPLVLAALALARGGTE